MNFRMGDIIEATSAWQDHPPILGAVLEVYEIQGCISVRLFKSRYTQMYYKEHLRVICSPASLIEEFLS